MNWIIIENHEEQVMLLNELFLLINTDLYHEKLLEQNRQNRIIQKCCRYINENLEKDITLHTLAETACLSPNYFLRLFKQEMGITPKEYILRIRLDHACILLSGTNLKISTIASECGFNDSSYFSSFFKKHFGITPKEYRENN